MSALFLLLLLIQSSSAQRDTTGATDPSVGIIRGRVLDRQTGAPVPDALVFTVARDPRRARTGPDGTYELVVPAGSYHIACDPPEYDGRLVAARHGSDLPFDPMQPASVSPLEIVAGKVLDKIDCLLLRTFAIEGRVTGRQGEPLAGIYVLARPTERLPGASPRSDNTDDLGRYRIYGLLPGDYHVHVTPNDDPGSTDAVPGRAVATYFPSAYGKEEAERVRISTVDVGGVDIRLRYARTFTLSGVAVDSSSLPINAPAGSVRLARAGNRFDPVRVTEGGRFEVHGLLPGDYDLMAQVGGYDAPLTELGRMRLAIDSDMRDVVIRTEPPARVRGTVLFESAVRQPPPSHYLRISRAYDPEFHLGWGVSHDGEVKPDGTFEVTDLFVPSILRVDNIPKGWYVKSVRYRGDDITDERITFRTSLDPAALRITLSSPGAEVQGRVFDERGRPVSGARVVMLSINPEKWFPDATTTFVVTSGADGTYLIPGRRAGEYLLVAAAGFPEHTNNLATDFAPFAPKAERVILREDEQRTLDLVVKNKS